MQVLLLKVRIKWCSFDFEKMLQKAGSASVLHEAKKKKKKQKQQIQTYYAALKKSFVQRIEFFKICVYNKYERQILSISLDLTYFISLSIHLKNFISKYETLWIRIFIFKELLCLLNIQNSGLDLFQVWRLFCANSYL